jgi:hypothetical protein
LAEAMKQICVLQRLPGKETTNIETDREAAEYGGARILIARPPLLPRKER